MPLLISCACGKKLKVREELAGKKVKCPACGGAIPVQTPAGGKPAAPKEAASARVPASPAAPKQPPPAKTSPAKAPPTPKRPAPSVPPPLPDDLDEDEPTPVRGKAKGRIAPDESETESEGDDRARGGPRSHRCVTGRWKRLAAFTADGIYFADFDSEKQLASAEDDLAEGEPPQEALGEKVQFLPFEKITSIETNKHLAELHAYFPGDDNETTSIDFFFADGKTRDRAFADLRDILEPDWKYTRKDYTPVTAAVKPLVTIGVILAITIGLIVVHHWLSNWTGEARIPVLVAFLYHALMFLGKPGVSIIGGLIIACCAIWLVIRVRKPPIMLTLKPTGKPAKKKQREEEEDEEGDEEDED